MARLQALGISQVGIFHDRAQRIGYGVSKSSKPEQNKLALAEFVAPLEIIAYGDAAAAHYGRIRTLLERQGTPIGRLDTLIAAHASALGCTLVTNNDREFSRIPNLVVENWIS